MSGDRLPTVRDTSLALIGLVLIVGVTLGWLLRDMLGRPSTQAVAPTALVATAAISAATAAPATALPTAPPEPAPPTALPAAPTTPPEPATALPAAPTTPPEPATALPDTPTTPPEPATALPDAPTIPPAPVPTSASQEIVGYVGHVVALGETLETIAANGGSTPELLASYNRLSGAPPPGRALIVPQLAGQPSALENVPILLQRGRDDKPWVALTLDAGASAAPVPRMLQTLREHNVQITFFLTGAWIKDNPDLAKQIVADGHEIANHTFTHPDLTNLDEESIRKELADTEALMQQTTGTTTRPLFRPPFGAYDKRVLRIVESEGYLPIYWTLDSLDSVGELKTPDFLLERITEKLTPDELRGAIILAHCGSEPTADALPRILDRFAELGFEVKKVSEVLGP